MKIAVGDLGLTSLTVIYPGSESFPLSAKVAAMGFKQFVKKYKNIRKGRTS